MEAWPRFLRRSSDVVAPQSRSYLFLPRPFPPPSWCGARRLGDTHHKPCGTRERDLAAEAPRRAVVLPTPSPPRTEAGVLWAQGNHLLIRFQSPPWPDCDCQGRSVPCLFVYLLILFSFFPRRLRCTPELGADLAAPARYPVPPRKASAHPNRGQASGSLASPLS